MGGGRMGGMGGGGYGRGGGSGAGFEGGMGSAGMGDMAGMGQMGAMGMGQMGGMAGYGMGAPPTPLMFLLGSSHGTLRFWDLPQQASLVIWYTIEWIAVVTRIAA